MTLPNVVVCGAPRSGTSMMANVLSDSGLATSDQLLSPSLSNPRGFFEDVRVNRLNDDLLCSLDRVDASAGLPRRLWWMAGFRSSTLPEVVLDRDVDDLLPPPPFVLKDPRFSMTLPAWKIHLLPFVAIVMVRPPAEVATSLASMIRREPEYFAPVASASPDDLRAMTSALWSATYRSVLEWADEATYFLTPSDVFDEAILVGLGTRLGRAIGASCVDSDLRRSEPMRGVSVDSNIRAAVLGRLALDRRRLLSPSSPQ